MASVSVLLQTTKRPAAVVVCVWLSLVGVGLTLPGSNCSSSLTLHQSSWPGSFDRRERALISVAGSTFGAMLARRNHTVLTTKVGRSTGGRGIAMALSYKKLLSYQQSADVATSGASSPSISFSLPGFSLRMLGKAIIDAATPHHPIHNDIPKMVVVWDLFPWN